MAVRRPPSRVQGNMSSQNGPRPKSALAKLVSETSTAESHNIQVVIRTRRRSEREKEENSPNIISCDGPKSHDITVQTGSPVSTFGVVSLPPARTYPFDLVFGPDADQSLIYQEVVSPMLEQVLAGYNCTLFAYGQTGTGKTYTMQGDLSPTPMGNPSAHAGMIPRVLFRMFHTLDASSADYSVKISYVELYNEDLRDLLSPELSSQQSDGGLKIFDDVKKGGVVIQGVEEILVKSSKDALGLLQRGSDRRQIAATKFNDHSSRSHSIFSITVHIKEAAAAGEDMLKIGKMNLVDLAGSENIGRSGAENKRAREAGMINQSLLTLGRVITSLVDKTPHVPYRESKLTRLLQDSLGGRTKTCIIATISPARSNLEETLSTLDYALRAKSIKNKPEVNARMSRNSLLREYVAEIERLKSDVLSAREKNGIFVSEERWDEVTRDQELRQTELDETKRQITIIEGQMRTLRDEYDQSIALISQRNEELASTKTSLAAALERVEERENAALQLKRQLDEETIVRQAHQATETHLNHVSSGLRDVVRRSLQDLEGVFAKLDRQGVVLQSRSDLVHTVSQSVVESTTEMAQITEQFNEASNSLTTQLTTDVHTFQQSNVIALRRHCSTVEESMQTLSEIIGTLESRDEQEAKALHHLKTVVSDSQSSLTAFFVQWARQLIASCDKTCVETQSLAKTTFATATDVVKGTSMLMDQLAVDFASFIDNVHASLGDTHRLASDHADQEITRLQQQNLRLLALLAEEKSRGEKMKEDVLQRIGGMLGEYLVEKDRKLRESIGYEARQNDESSKAAATFAQHHNRAAQEAKMMATTAQKEVQRKGGEGKRLRNGVLKEMESSQASLSRGLDNLRRHISQEVDTSSTTLQNQVALLNGEVSEDLEHYSKAKRARIDTRNSLFGNLHTQYSTIQKTLTSTAGDIEALSSAVSTKTASSLSLSDEYRTASTSHLASLRSTAEGVLAQIDNEVATTGKTPRKRVWKYTDHWKLTKPRSELLDDPQLFEPMPPESLIDLPRPGPSSSQVKDVEMTEANQIACEPEGPSEPLQENLPPRKPHTRARSKVAVLRQPDLGALPEAPNTITTRGSRRGR